jgi:excisionase family DNA binding protein
MKRGQPTDSHTPLALNRAQAAAALGVSLNTFERHVQPQLRVVRVGRLRLFHAKELERWLELNAARTVE